MSQVVASILISASTFTNPTTPKGLSFDASAFVTANNQIRLAVNKGSEKPVLIILRNRSNEVLFRRSLSKNESTYAVKLNVDDLVDGTYELEFKSDEGSIIKQITLGPAPVQKVTRIVAMQ
ncbi:hypothetical protein [Spirosoma aerolatum]|uniref:hypothetical protein n=1 Tax=Spirosoma aerolatum TaxID=1211326 RepID=UPI0009ADD2C4|nr:hypothetical protein [Spirosoma aerolatum]